MAMTSDHWSGPTRPYDLVKEVVVAVVAMAALALTLAAVFSSPDDRQVTIQRWATADPAGFVATAVTELDGTSASAAYGPPYNRASDGQSIFALHLQRWVGVHQPVDPSQDFVLRPLSTVTGDPVLTSALASYTAAPGGQQQRWASAYDAAIGTAGGDPAKAAPGDYGPVPTLVTSLAGLARTGALDSQLVGHSAGLYQADSTSPLLFLADGDYLAAQAHARHLTGTQWGMMNETGSYPGQAWLWLYTFWYQIPPFTHSGNADALIWGLMMVLSLGLVLVPFIPGLRSLPRLLPVHRLVWRDWYASHPAGRPPRTVRSGRG
ncbi:MAG TPA: hypothetical protein VFP61_02665 [Acidimicrobiales bacterium]|nr:hypothetical protein [Acidimicrobiales bacterium]